MIDGRHGSNVHNSSASLSKHDRNSSTAQHITGKQVEGQHLIENLCVHLPQRTTSAVTTNGVYQDIQAATLRDDRSDQLTNRGFVGYVDAVPFQARDPVAYCSRERIEFTLPSVSRNNGSTLREERCAHLSSQSSRASGHQYDLF